MGWVAPVLGVATTLFGANQQKKAASAQQNAAQGSMDWIKEVYGNSQANFAPYLQGGQQGLAALMGNQYEQSPGYQYLKDEMVSGIDASAAARGQLYSGGHSLDLARHVNGLAAQDYNNWWNRQMGLAGLGAQSATALGGIGSGTFNGVQSAYGSMADAAGQKAGANAGAVSGIGNILGNYFAPAPNVSQSSYGSTNYGVPGPVDPYANTSYGSNGSWYG